MSRIETVENPNGKALELLQMVDKKMGRRPNMMKTLANSPATLELYLQMSGVLANSTINVKNRERIALLSAELNSCGYCDKAHSAIGASVGLTSDEIEASKKAQASDVKSQALLTLTKAIIEKKGHISDEEFNSAKAAGLTDENILEVVGLSALNIFTNYVNHVADPVIDF